MMSVSAVEDGQISVASLAVVHLQDELLFVVPPLPRQMQAVDGRVPEGRGRRRQRCVAHRCVHHNIRVITGRQTTS